MEARLVTSKAELDAAFHIRRIVFVEEQNCPPEEEYDEHDAVEADTEHIIVWDKDQPVGTGRWRIADGKAKLERICVLASHRKHGVGKIIVEALEKLAQNKGIQYAKLHGQTQAEAFYEKLGYRADPDSGIFMEAGIPHKRMVKQLKNL